jgi:hypothetical protein
MEIKFGLEVMTTSLGRIPSKLWAGIVVKFGQFAIEN